jgi:hypothetical protein
MHEKVPSPLPRLFPSVSKKEQDRRILYNTVAFPWNTLSSAFEKSSTSVRKSPITGLYELLQRKVRTDGMEGENQVYP